MYTNNGYEEIKVKTAMQERPGKFNIGDGIWAKKFRG